MFTRQLGRSGITVSAVGFGCWRAMDFGPLTAEHMAQIESILKQGSDERSHVSTL